MHELLRVQRGMLPGLLLPRLLRCRVPLVRSKRAVPVWYLRLRGLVDGPLLHELIRPENGAAHVR